MDIVKLNEINYEETLNATKMNFNERKEEIKEALKSVMGCLPHKNNIMGRFIIDLSKDCDIKDFVLDNLTELLESEEICIVVSSVIYAKLLDFNLLFDEFKFNVLENSPFKGHPITIGEVKKIKILQSLERIRQFVCTIDPKEEQNVLIYFFFISIIKNFKFSVSECLNELQGLTEERVIFTSIVYLSE